MTLSEDYVRTLFRELEKENGESFFKHVADDVDWTVMGTHPLAGHYTSKKAFLDATFAKLIPLFPYGLQLHVEDITIAGSRAIVELRSMATAKSGLRFDNRYCWVIDFKDLQIIRVRAYLDSALVARLFEEK
jgi:ketosteroid isomerase-like protein